MKKLISLTSIIILLTGIGYGQSPRMVLAEEFTNASCGPCASQNPAFDALLAANEDIITSIKYHTSWPGTDPMYTHNPQQSGVRVGYYNVSGVPYCLIDGEPPTGGSYTGAPSNVNQSKINAAAAIPSPFTIQYHHELSADEDSIYMTMLIEATDDVGGYLVAHMVVIEKHIHFTYPPGSNGEKDFYNVMKWMIPSADGTDLPDFESGDYLILEGAWELANVYDIDELGAVGFVQNNTSKDVHQAANSSTDPITPLYSYDSQVKTVLNVGEANCTGTVTPTVSIRNNGAETLTSLTIKYEVNGGDVQTYDWTGSLDFLETANIELSEVTFDLADNNALTIYSEQPSGHGDEYLKNDTLVFEFVKAFVTDDHVTLTMRLDDNPEETSWEIVNSSGEVVHSGGNYTQPNQFINENYDFTEEDCYTFTIYDTGGDGLTGGGFVSLHIGSDVILQATTFGYEASNNFEYATFIDIPEEQAVSTYQLYPNPVSDRLYLSMDDNMDESVKVEVWDISGRIIKSVDLAGHNSSIDVSGLNKGIYFVKLEIGTRSFIEKITIR